MRPVARPPAIVFAGRDANLFGQSRSSVKACGQQTPLSMIRLAVDEWLQRLQSFFHRQASRQSGGPVCNLLQYRLLGECHEAATRQIEQQRVCYNRATAPLGRHVASWTNRCS